MVAASVAPMRLVMHRSSTGGVISGHDTVQRQVGEKPAPAVLGVGLVVAGAIVGVETVAGVLVNDDVRASLAGGGQRLAHLRRCLRERVLAAVESEHRTMQARDVLDRPNLAR